MEIAKSKKLPIPKAKASVQSFAERKAISQKQEQMAMLREFNIAAREKLMNKRVLQIVEERSYALRVEREELDLRNILKRSELLEEKNRIAAEEQLKADDRKEKDRLREENIQRRYQAWTDSVTAELLEKKAERARLQQERTEQRDHRIFMRGVERDKSMKSQRLVEEESQRLNRKREINFAVVERSNLQAQADYTAKIIREKAASKDIEQQQLDEKKRLYMYKKHQLKYQQLERGQERKEKEEVQAKREEAIARKIRLRELREVERIMELKKQGKAEAAEILLEKERRASASRYAERMRQEELEDERHAKQELEARRAAAVQEAELRQAEQLMAVDKAAAEAAAQLRTEAAESARSAQEMAIIQAEALALEKQQSRDAAAAAQKLNARRAESIARLEAQHEADSMKSYHTARATAEERSELGARRRHEQKLEKEMASKLALQELKKKEEEERELEESRRRAIEELEHAREVRATQWAHDQHALAKHQVA